MSRRQWTGLAAVLFGAVMLAGVITSGTTPDATGSGAVERYQDYWEDSGHQDRAALGSIILTYACVLLLAFAAGLRHLLRRLDDGPLPSVVLAGGVAAAALLGAGGPLVNAVGIASAESGYEVDGNSALLLEGVGYYLLTTGIMSAGAMVVAASLSNRRSRVLPQWTVVLTVIVALATLGSIFTAWIGFIAFPVWAVVVGGCLLALRDTVGTEDGGRVSVP